MLTMLMMGADDDADDRENYINKLPNSRSTAPRAPNISSSSSSSSSTSSSSRSSSSCGGGVVVVVAAVVVVIVVVVVVVVVVVEVLVGVSLLSVLPLLLPLSLQKG